MLGYYKICFQLVSRIKNFLTTFFKNDPLSFILLFWLILTNSMNFAFRIFFCIIRIDFSQVSKLPYE